MKVFILHYASYHPNHMVQDEELTPFREWADALAQFNKIVDDIRKGYSDDYEIDINEARREASCVMHDQSYTKRKFMSYLITLEPYEVL